MTTPHAAALKIAEELIALAEKATPGPWFHRQATFTPPYPNDEEEYDWLADAPDKVQHNKIIIPRESLYGGRPDYAYLAAANPKAVADLARAYKALCERTALLSVERDFVEAYRSKICPLPLANATELDTAMRCAIGIITRITSPAPEADETLQAGTAHQAPASDLKDVAGRTGVGLSSLPPVEPAPARVTEDEEAQYQTACELVVKHQKASASFIRRHLQIGYNRAARITERMEVECIIAPPDRVGTRRVLVDRLSGRAQMSYGARIDRLEKRVKALEDSAVLSTLRKPAQRFVMRLFLDQSVLTKTEIATRSARVCKGKHLSNVLASLVRSSHLSKAGYGVYEIRTEP